MNKPVKHKVCRVCKTEFKLERSLQKVCSFQCALEIYRQKQEKKERQELKRRKEGIKTTSELLAETQKVFNEYIRKRDKDLPCISCGRFHEGQYHAGHFRTTGSAAHLRFNEDNVHKQCSACNNYRSGNLIPYRQNLIEKIGLERVVALENNNETVKWDKDEIREIKKIYREKIKKLF